MASTATTEVQVRTPEEYLCLVSMQASCGRAVAARSRLVHTPAELPSSASDHSSRADGHDLPDLAGLRREARSAFVHLEIGFFRSSFLHLLIEEHAEQ